MIYCYTCRKKISVHKIKHHNASKEHIDKCKKKLTIVFD